MQGRSTLGTVLAAVVVIAAAVVVLGVPDFGLAWQFLDGSYPSVSAGLALVSIMSWLLVLSFVLAVVIMAFRAASEAQLLIRRWTRAVTFCVIGGIVLGVGVYRHSSVGYAMSCHDCQQRITEATQLAGQ